MWLSLFGLLLRENPYYDNLRRRRILFVDWCCICKQDGASVDRLLFHCLMAREIWSFVVCLFGLQWVMPKKVVELLVCWNWRDSRNRMGVIWNAIPLCITLIIWKEWDNRTFEDLEHSLASVKLSLLCTLYAWMATLSGHSFSSMLDFLDY